MSRSLPCLLLPLLVACSDYSLLEREDVGGAGDGDGYPFLDPGSSDLGDDPLGGEGEDAWVDEGGASTDDGPGDTGESDPYDACEEALNFAEALDRYQVEGDGRVLYCHSSSGHNLVLVDSSIDSCLTHLDHRYDIFPTTLCDS